MSSRDAHHLEVIEDDLGVDVVKHELDLVCVGGRGEVGVTDACGHLLLYPLHPRVLTIRSDHFFLGDLLQGKEGNQITDVCSVFNHRELLCCIYNATVVWNLKQLKEALSVTFAYVTRWP